MNSLTPIQDIDQKIDITDHVNQDHTKELLAIAQSHQPKQQNEISSAKILDLFQEGVQLNVYFTSDTPTAKVFVPFEIEGELEDKILYLAYAAILKQGRDFSGTGKRFFEVINKQKITTNMVRLTIKSATSLPEYYPGYAYAFLLKTIKGKPNKYNTVNQKKHWGKNFFDRFFIWLIKHLSSNNRQKLLQNANKDIRLYTLRKSWQSSNGTGLLDQGYIDIFTHGDTAGSQWTNELNVGDVIMSRSGSADKHPHLANSQALLIADETAYPAMAGILEHWQNPLAPHIIVISSAKDEQDYFPDNILPNGALIQRVICPATKQADEVLAIVKQLENIDVIWAAFESNAAKEVRHYLRNERQVIGKNNHTKAYWLLEK